jgi:hypothetical protein
MNRGGIMNGFDINSIIATFTQWINEGHEAIMWLSGITGLSSAMILFIAICMGKSIVKFVFNLLKVIFVIALVLFLLSWYVKSGNQLPSFHEFGLPTLEEVQATGEGIIGAH